MPMCRVFQNPDGTVRVMRLNERHRRKDETDEQFFARETAKQPGLAGLPFTDVDRSALPTDRSVRHAWRLQAGTVIVDPAVPMPPHPRQALLDAVEAAATMDQLKAVLRSVIQGG